METITPTLDAETEAVQAIAPNESETVHDFQPTAEGATSGTLDLETLEALTEGYLNGSLQLADETAPKTEPEPVQETPVETVTAVEPEVETEPEETNPKNGFRLKTTDPVEAKAMRIYKAAAGSVSLEQALTLAKGEKTPVAEVAASETEASVPYGALEAEVAQIKEDLRQAGESLDFDRQTELQIELADKLGDLKLAKAEHLRNEALAAQSAEAAAAAAAAKFEAEFQEHNAKAVGLYPDAAKQGSAMWNEMAAIHAALVSNGDPAADAPDAPLVVARMAARNLGIAPANVKAVVKQTPITAPAIQPRPLSAGGSSAGQQSQAVNFDLTKLSTEDLDAITEAMLKRTA